jgi:hypothetical protein
VIYVLKIICDDECCGSREKNCFVIKEMHLKLGVNSGLVAMCTVRSACLGVWVASFKLLQLSTTIN